MTNQMKLIKAHLQDDIWKHRWAAQIVTKYPPLLSRVEWNCDPLKTQIL